MQPRLCNEDFRNVAQLGFCNVEQLGFCNLATSQVKFTVIFPYILIWIQLSTVLIFTEVLPCLADTIRTPCTSVAHYTEIYHSAQ